VPLIVITADRPAELRNSGEGQTIDQLKLYGSFAHFHELSAAGHAGEEWWRATACRAFAQAIGPRPGPVHLNLPLRDPLIAQPADLLLGRSDGLPWISVAQVTKPNASEALSAAFARSSRPVIVAGRDESKAASAVAEFASVNSIPLLSDVLSGAKSGAGCISLWDPILRSVDWAHAHLPDLIVRTGDLPTSKPLRNWLSKAGGAGAEIFQFDPDEGWRDPNSTTSVRTTADIVATFTETSVERLASEWFSEWQQADKLAEETLAASVLGNDHPISEPAIAADIYASLPDGATLVSAASMPIRDLDSFSAARSPALRVIANRGANGIDGTIATAAGIAAASSGPVCVLCGDVAFNYDIASLGLVREASKPVTLVVVDNGGGGIFDFLPVSSAGQAFEKFIATPPQRSIEAASKAWAIDYMLIDDRRALGEVMSAAGSRSAPLLVHVRTARASNVELHRRAFENVSNALAISQ
jgi:2-succinyl-5-enolpyruvyl-6-hydroxy-3-cyclohexene-1-carboxylate synthase